MLVEFHLIQNHAPSNLNRDDTGSPKEAVFGGYKRARISSQCLKRSIRRSEIFQSALEGQVATRSRQIATRLRPVLEALECDEAVIELIAKKATALGSGKESDKGETRQTMFLGDEEVSRLGRQLVALYDADRAAFASLKNEDVEKALKDASLPRSVDIALFGRMTTSAAFEDVSAAMQVAHALSTSKVERQFDYYTAVDDLPSPEDGMGADMIGDVEFNSATYYKYFSLDWTQLLKNLGGDEEAARKTLAAFIQAMALTTPTGKQNSFAAHNPPDGILVEVKEQRVPVSYANAFVEPARPNGEGDLVAVSIGKLAQYAGQLKRSYGLAGQSFWLSTRDVPVVGALSVESLAGLSEAVLQAIPSGRP